MTIRSWSEVLSASMGQRIISGSFIPNGSGAIATTYGVGFSVARSAVGVWTVTLEEAFYDFLSIKVNGQLATATLTPTHVRVGDISVANKTFDIVNASRTGQVNVYAGAIANISSASTIYAVAPVAGVISSAYGVLQGAITVANSTVQGKINGTNITGGLLTAVQSGSAAGDVSTCTPSAANVVAAGDKVSWVNAAGSTGAVAYPIWYTIDQFVAADISTSGTANKINFEVAIARQHFPGAGA